MRLATGGVIDRNRPVYFDFNGRRLHGFAGDTLASALLANGLRGVARSLKYHRLRGIYSAGLEEPNALVRIGDGPTVLPNQPATIVELYDGLRARSLNYWPTVRFDLGRVNDLLSMLLPAGFYYKTFMWPGSAWMLYESIIRRAAGVARTPTHADPDRYAKRAATIDVLVVGGGCAGLAAALAAGRSGARVMLCERDPRLGGQLHWRPGENPGIDATTWLAGISDALRAMPNVHVLTRTTAVGIYDHNLVTLVERVTDHLSATPARLPRERLWKIRAKEVVVAAGAFERLLVFPGNDLPGVMLASAAQRYVNEFAVTPGRRAAVFTNNDSGYAVALALRAAAIDVAVVVDVRPDGVASAAARQAGLRVEVGSAVVAAVGRRAVTGIRIDVVAERNRRIASKAAIACDCLLVAGGWDPAVHLYSQSGGRLEFDSAQQCFVPESPGRGIAAAGAANGVFDTSHCMADGAAAGTVAAARAGFEDSSTSRPARAGFGDSSTSRPARIRSESTVASDPGAEGRSKSFVDLQSDVTAADLRLAAQEGFTASEHAKRYTTTGMGIDQGKVGNIAALTVLGAATGRSVWALGPTTYRPPFVPVTFGAFAGREVGALFDPTRETPIGDWHEHAGAVLEPVGLWRRPSRYPRQGERAAATVERECRAVRGRVGMLDASTLGKIEIVGPDAVVLLDRIYTNAWGNLAIGQCRYGLMLRESGMVFDDGVCARLGEHRYLMSTTSGNARGVANWLEEWLQCEWPDLRVHVLPVTAQWATIVLTGPLAREVIQGCATDVDFSAAAFPHMALREGHLAGAPARILGVSFTGERSYEINVPARYGRALWEHLLEQGAVHGIVPVGLDAIDALRIEKGFVAVGHDTDGTVTPGDLGMDWIVSRKKGDFVGRRGLACVDAMRAGRRQLVGLLTDDPVRVPREGSPIVAAADAARIHRPPVPMIGHVTSSAHGVAVGRSVTLAMVADGRARIGERVTIVERGKAIEAAIVAPRFLDPEGSRLHG
ncbi:MAG: sarcosine oxidase subunit alpha family protein [Casimicrobiaceae bacterium]